MINRRDGGSLRKPGIGLLLLLVLPFLSGVSGRTDMPIAQGHHSADHITAAAFTATQAALPGIAAPTVIADAGTFSSWRTPVRTPRADGPSSPAHGETPDRIRADDLGRGFLGYRNTLERARANTPVSYGNPPPSSLT